MDILAHTQTETPDAPTPAQRWQAYEEYRDSGVEWVGEIPAHWKVERLKFNSYIKGRVGWQNLRSSEFTDEGPYLITGMHFLDGSIDWDACYHITQDRYEMAPEIQIRKHDVLLTKDGSIGKLAYIDDLPGPTSLNSHLLVIRPLNNRYIPRYLYHLLGSDVFKTYTSINQMGTTFFGITQECVVNFPCILPSLPEQRAIAAFLDRKTASIDTLIAKKEQLIALLQEKRAALISQAVTRGLRPDVPMKDSGVLWLGMVPEHWEVRRLKRSVKDMIAGPFGSSLTKDMYTKEGYKVYGQEQVIPADFSIGDYYIPLEIYDAMRQYAIASGDVLISCVGTFGKVAVVPPDAEPGIINPRLAKLVSDKKIVSSAYLGLLLKSRIAFEQMERLSRGGTMGVINLGLLANILLPLPPPNEQEAILNYLNQQTTKIDNLITGIREGIEKVKEYRVALISAAVTGKIDVRGALAGDEHVEERAAD